MSDDSVLNEGINVNGMTITNVVHPTTSIDVSNNISIGQVSMTNNSLSISFPKYECFMCTKESSEVYEMSFNLEGDNVSKDICSKCGDIFREELNKPITYNWLDFQFNLDRMDLVKSVYKNSSSDWGINTGGSIALDWGEGSTVIMKQLSEQLMGRIKREFTFTQEEIDWILIK